MATETQIVRRAPEIEAYKLALMKKARAGGKERGERNGSGEMEMEGKR